MAERILSSVILFILWTRPAGAALRGARLCLMPIAMLLALLAVQQSAYAKPVDDILITADEMTSNSETGITTAHGHVELAYNGYLLRADRLTYNQKTDVARAEGHVAMMSPSGEVQFSDAQELTGDMKQAFAQNIGILFPDNSRLAAASAERFDGRWLVAKKGLYTACNCPDDPAQPPLWQLRAKEVTHDNLEKNIYYHSATIDVDGWPVFYTPYFSMPDPTVNRRQGFLTPTPGTSPNLGVFVRTPYYLDLGTDKDATLSPTFSTKDKAQFDGEYRQRFDKGRLLLNGSITHANLVSDNGVDKGNRWRGHLFGNYLHNINSVWRAGTDIQLSTDKSYLKRYRYASPDELVNRAYLEGFSGRNYAVINTYYYQDLRPGSRPVEPLVLPQAQFNALGDPADLWGGRWSLDGSLLVTSRGNDDQPLANQGPNTRRLNLQAGWQRRLLSDMGFVTDINGLLRTDVYSADNVRKQDDTGVYNNVAFVRPFEQATLTTRYPLGRHGDGYQQTLEPIVGLVAAPVVHVSQKQPIEDSYDVEFDETSLFSPNRFTGNDLVEGGSRAIYGIRHAITLDNGKRIDMFGGQSYSFDRNPQFNLSSGLHDKWSDYVGRIAVIPADWLDLSYGFRLNKENFSPDYQDAFVSAGIPQFRPYSRYTEAIQLTSTDEPQKFQEAHFGFSSRLSTFWTLGASHVRSFSPSPGPRTTGMALTYHDECMTFVVNASRDDTNRADINSGTSLSFQIILRNVGGVQTGN